MRMLVVSAILTLIVGCTPSPEGVCEQVTRVVERSWPPDPKDPGAHDRAVAHCTTKWAQRKKEDAKAYKCYADCIDRVKYVVDLGSCESKCYPNMKLADETDKLEGLIAFPDAAPSTTPEPRAPASGPSTTASSSK